MRARMTWLVSGFAGGVVAGLLVWSGRARRSRRDLFSQVRRRREAALGYLRGQRNLSTVHLLRDYVNWETHPRLRRRGQRMLRRMEEALE